MNEIREQICYYWNAQAFEHYLNSRGWQFVKQRERWYYNDECIVYNFICDTGQFMQVLDWLTQNNK